MKRLHFSLFFLCLLFIFFSCQKEFSSNHTGTIDAENTLPAPVSATLQGNILDENGAPAGNVQIKAGTETTTTNVNGYFRIINAQLDKNASMVIAEAPGYFKAYRTFQATTGVNQVTIKLIRKTQGGTIDAGSGGDVSLTNNAKITLPANGVVKASGGSPYSGNVNVYAAYIDPSAPDIRQTIPGSFMGDDQSNQRVVLTSFGMLAVELESSNGEKLQMAPGKTAILTFPVPPSKQASAPSKISLWYIDEQTGIWKEEGTAARNGNNYVGEVKHFSFWNCDFSGAGIKLSMTLKNPKGLPLVYASLQVTGAKSGAAHGYTDSLGQVSGLVPSNENLVLEVLDECGNVIFSKDIGPFNQNTDLGDLTVSNTGSSFITINGKILNCSNTPVSDGYAMIYFDNILRYAAVNDNGEFTTTLIRCAGASGTCKVFGIDNSSQQQGSATEVNLASPVTDVANITACGNSSLQYINYTLDGVKYSISDALQDSLIAYSFPGTTDFVTYVTGTHFPDDHIWFNFNSSSTTGSYPIENLSVQNYTKLFAAPLNVNLTSYPQNPGEFYEGNFSGQFNDSLKATPVHSINCSFRLRRY